MARKKKKKKQRKPNIPAYTMARPRLEKVLVRYEQDEVDEVEYIAAIEALMKDISREAIINAMIGLLENAGNERKDALMVAIPKLGNQQTIKHLWQLVRRSKMSMGAKMTAIVILKQMGEEVDLDNPGQYFSWRDIKKADVDEVSSIGRFGLQGIIKELQRTRNVDEVDAIMMHFEDIMKRVGGAEVVGVIIDELVKMANSGAVDMLVAIAATTSQPKIRKAARTGLLKLSGQKIFPQSEVIKSLQEERFYAAYSSDPAQPWQQQVFILYERGKNMVQVLVFLLDFGHPWHGAIKDFFPTQSITPAQFQRDMIDKANRQGVEQRQIPYARARQFILDALEINQKKKVKLPPEFEQYHHWIVQRIIDPSPETMAYAKQIDAQTVDEWGELEGEPVRGMEIIGLDGEPMPIVVMGDPEDEFWGEEYELTFDELLEEINKQYKLEAEENDGEPILPQEWLVGYLTTCHNEDVGEADLEEYWDNIGEFVFYLETGLDTPSDLADVQGSHLSEFITKYWNEMFDPQASLESKKYVVDIIQDLYTYLSEQGHIPADSAQRITEATTMLFKHKDKLTPIHK